MPADFASGVLFESPAEIFARVHRMLRPRTVIPEIDFEFKTFANADSKIRLEDGKLTVRISDVLRDAPAPVIEALAFILVGKLYRRPAEKQYLHRYRLHMNRKDVRGQIHEVRQARGRKVHKGPKGAVHDLEEVFEDLNQKYFGGMMVRPELGWSFVRSRSRLGHFDPSHGMIMISRIFDDPRVPKITLEYVMFHEMLHLHYPVDHTRTRRCVHTKEFKAHEKQFPGFEEAKALLKKICATG